jgi:hypothetical protein
MAWIFKIKTTKTPWTKITHKKWNYLIIEYYFYIKKKDDVLWQIIE